jgi:hypothetical protein
VKILEFAFKFSEIPACLPFRFLFRNFPLSATQYYGRKTITIRGRISDVQAHFQDNSQPKPKTITEEMRPGAEFSVIAV